MVINNLGVSFLGQFKHLGQVGDVKEAIEAPKLALRLAPSGHPDKPMYFNNLGLSFHSRFEHLTNIADIDEAITAQQQAVHLTPDNHPQKTTCLCNLGDFLSSRWTTQHDGTALAEAIATYSQSSQSLSGPPSERFRSARSWATLCYMGHSNDIIEAYSTIINLLPPVVWFGKTVEQRYKDISSIGDGVAEAAAVAIHLGEFGLALEWLEQGRSIVWGQILQLRTPLDNLRQRHPGEANKLEEISRALESAGTTQSTDHSSSSSVVTSPTLEEAVQAHCRLAKEYNHLVEHIHTFPDFGDFLLP